MRNEIREVAKVIAEYVPLSTNRIADVLNNHANSVGMDINTKNLNNGVISLLYGRGCYVVVFTNYSICGINITDDEYMNEYECSIFYDLDPDEII